MFAKHLIPMSDRDQYSANMTSSKNQTLAIERVISGWTSRFMVSKIKTVR